MALSPLPPAPNRQNPVQFPARSDAFFAALVGFRNEINALIGDFNNTAGSKATLPNSWKMFSSRTAAVEFGQDNLPPAISRIVTTEGDQWVLRGPGQTSDALFTGYPAWGIIHRVYISTAVDDLIATVEQNRVNDVGALRSEVRNGRVYYEAATDTPSGRDIPDWADFVITAHFASGVTRAWRPRGAPEGGLETDNIKLDANGRWWTRMQDAAVGNAIRDGGIITTVNIGGTGDAITADIAPAFIEAGITALGGASEIEYIPVATNTADNPTFSIGGQGFAIRNADGTVWPADGFIVGRSYKLRRRGGILRVVNGDATSVELAALSFLVAGKADIADSGKIFASRQGAVDAGQINLPPALTRILTLEESGIVIRGPGVTGDQLFTTFPNWGIIQQVPYRSVVETMLSQLDSNRISVDRVASLIPIVNVTVSGTVDGITTLDGTVSSSAESNGVIPVGGSVIRFTMPSGAVGPLRLNIAGDTDRALMDERNAGALTADEVIPGSVLVFERRGGNWILVSGRRPTPFLGDESFRVPDTMDEVWYKLLSARDGTPWLGAYVDGSWAAPTAFGAFRWAGDDMIIFETQSGEPLLAFAPDGSLIFKERA